MKIFCIPILLLFLFSCNQKPKHPQAALINQGTASAMNEQEILQYADSIDANSKNLEKQISLVYQMGEKSMYAEQYNWNGTTMMYTEYISDEGISRQSSKYYFKNDSLVLVKEHHSMERESEGKYEDNRAYIRSNITFKKESRTAGTEVALKSKAYTTSQAPLKPSAEFAENISLLKDAIQASNKFEVIFDHISPASDESRIVLKSKLPDGYNADIVVKDSDPFIDSLIGRPELFKDKRLNIKWQVKDKEAVYVPVASSVTSARGLNK
jgi:hypothetical protein